MEAERDQWQRAKALYTQVLRLGTRSPHRADALFHLGWIEYRLGNRTEAHAHFNAFSDSFPHDERGEEAEAMSVVCRAEELSLQAERLCESLDIHSRERARDKRLEVLHYIDSNHFRVQNLGYRSILRLLALRSGLESMRSLEEDGDFVKADTAYRQLRRVLGFGCADTDLRDSLAEIIVKHIQAPADDSFGASRQKRAKALLERLANEFPENEKTGAAQSEQYQSAENKNGMIRPDGGRVAVQAGRFYLQGTGAYSLVRTGTNS